MGQAYGFDYQITLVQSLISKIILILIKKGLAVHLILLIMY